MLCLQNTTFEVLSCKLAYYLQGDVLRAHHAILMRDEPKQPCLRRTLYKPVIGKCYLLKTTFLYMTFIWLACHWQNRQLANSSPRITTWPLERASANGFSWPIFHEEGRWHVLEPSLWTNKASKIAGRRMLTGRILSKKNCNENIVYQYFKNCESTEIPTPVFSKWVPNVY